MDEDKFIGAVTFDENEKNRKGYEKTFNRTKIVNETVKG